MGRGGDDSTRIGARRQQVSRRGRHRGGGLHVFCVGGRHRTLVTDEVAALRPQVDADARLCSTEAQAAAASGLAHQAQAKNWPLQIGAGFRLRKACRRLDMKGYRHGWSPLRARIVLAVNLKAVFLCWQK